MRDLFDIPLPGVTCTCETNPAQYDGPQRDCPIHGEKEEEPEPVIGGLTIYYWDGTYDEFSFEDIKYWIGRNDREFLTIVGKNDTGRIHIPWISIKKFLVAYNKKD
jgi:hypothetical protein